MDYCSTMFHKRKEDTKFIDMIHVLIINWHLVLVKSLLHKQKPHFSDSKFMF